MTAALVYLIGAPAAGKSTLMAALTAGCTRHLVEQPLAHEILTVPRHPGVRAVELGRRRTTFAGTDALSLNVQPRAVAWITTTAHDLVLGEGDRLANLGFLLAARHAGYHVHLLVLDAPTTVLDARCAHRGSHQSPAWRTGRRTKVDRLAGNADAHGLTVTHLDARHPPEHVVGQALTAAPPLTLLQPTAARVGLP